MVTVIRGLSCACVKPSGCPISSKHQCGSMEVTVVSVNACQPSPWCLFLHGSHDRFLSSWNSKMRGMCWTQNVENMCAGLHIPLLPTHISMHSHIRTLTHLHSFSYTDTKLILNNFRDYLLNAAS